MGQRRSRDIREAGLQEIAGIIWGVIWPLLAGACVGVGLRLIFGGASWIEPTLIGLAALSLSLLIPAIARRLISLNLVMGA